MTISAVIHVANAKDTIRRALESVKFVDEIVIIDMESHDGSIEIAKKFTDKIYPHKNPGYVEPARNFGIGKATKDWVIILDADEEISDTLAKVLPELTKQPIDGWFLPRKNIVFGQWLQHTLWWPDYNLRFFKNGAVVWPDRIHGEPEISGKTEQLPPTAENAIVHHVYPTVNEFISRMNKYTTITASENKQSSEPAIASFWHEFMRRYFQFEGYKDGEIGMSVSLLQSFYEALVSIKRRESQGFSKRPIDISKVFSMIQSELAYWSADYEYHQASHFWSKLYWRIRRKFKL